MFYATFNNFNLFVHLLECINQILLPYIPIKGAEIYKPISVAPIKDTVYIHLKEKTTMTNKIPPILGNGDQGADVERLQGELFKLGYQIEVNGVFDQVTENVVKKFQQDKNLNVDGVVGAQTGQQIGAALAQL